MDTLEQINKNIEVLGEKPLPRDMRNALEEINETLCYWGLVVDGASPQFATLKSRHSKQQIKFRFAPSGLAKPLRDLAVEGSHVC